MQKKGTFSNLSFGGKLQTIRCECGQKILVIPDVKEMGHAIESHAEKHREKERIPDKGNSTFERIQDSLIEQLLDLASLEGEREKSNLILR